MGAAEQACARLAEQAAVRLEEAQALLRELAAANLAAASGEAAAALAPADSARVSKYLTAKTKVCLGFQGKVTLMIYSGSGRRYGGLRGHWGNVSCVDREIG